MAIELRDVTPADFPALVDMNRAAVPVLNELSLEEMAWFVGASVYFKVAAEADALHGFLIALTPDVQGYSCDNFPLVPSPLRRLRVRRSHHRRRGRAGPGLGQRVYEDLERFARGRVTRITCEVKHPPPQRRLPALPRPPRLQEVGTQDTGGGKKTVSLLSKPVGA